MDHNIPDMTSFVPGPASVIAYRDALGAFATGITVVTCQSPAGPLGITANSFSSVSLDPPLILWCPAKSSIRFEAFIKAKRFAIHVLAKNQRALCHHFATDGLTFDEIDWSEDDNGVPYFSGCAARFSCQHHALHDAGDHAIVVGRVTEVEHRPGAPLIFSGGRYGDFSD